MIRSSVTLASGAPPELERIVADVLASDEELARFAALVAPGIQTRVVRVPLATPEGARTFVLKRYQFPFIFAWRTLFVRSRARREFEALEALRPLVPSPVVASAWGERRSAGLAFRSVVVTELLPDAIDLKTWRLEQFHGRRPAGERARLLASLPELLRLVRRLHRAGFFAASAYHKNVLWRPALEGAAAFSLMDLPFAVKSDRPVGSARRVLDLACLDKDASMVLRATERLRLYLAYVGRDRLRARDKKRIARIARERRQLGHETFLRNLERQLKKRVKRSAAGKFLTGRDPDQRDRRPPA